MALNTTIAFSRLCRQPTPPSLHSTGIPFGCMSARRFSTQGSSLGKVSASDCMADVPVSPVSIAAEDAALHSPNIFLKPQVVVYDGVCHLCNAGINWLIRKDKNKRISFCAVQSEAAEPYLLVCGLTREDVLSRFLFVEGPAALRVALYLPYPYPMLAAFLGIPAPLQDAAYDFIAKRRYDWFGKSKSCILPSEDVLDRFIDREEILAKLRQRQGEP